MILENQLRRIIERDVNSLDKFISKKVNNKFIGKKNKQKLIELLPIILENTNIYNCNWMENNISFIKSAGFIDKLIGVVTTSNSFKTGLSVKTKSRAIGIGGCDIVNVPLGVRSFCPKPIEVAIYHHFIVTTFHYFILFILVALTNSCC